MSGIVNAAWQYFKVMVLFAVMTTILVIFGAILGMVFFGGAWPAMVFIFLLIALVMNLASYFFSDKIVLMSYGGRIVEPWEAPELHRIVEEVASAAGVPKPKVAIIPEASPNAFATGRGPGHAVVAVTQGILELLDRDELKAVIGHEMAHIKHRDILVMSVAATLASTISYLANMAMWGAIFGGGRRDDGGSILALIVTAITAPIAAMLVQMAVSRSREYYADRDGALFVKDPLALASALHHIEKGSRLYPMRSANPAHELMYISNPFSSRGFAALFSTHPPMEDRIERLKDLAREMGMM